MDSRTKRVSILVISNLLNFSVQFISPIILVRILDREAYGQYKEFFLYAGLLGGIIDFSIRNNILFFIPRNPSKKREYITNTIILKLTFLFIGLILILLFKDNLLKATTYNFLMPLLLYLIVSLSFNYLDIYWLTQKKSNLVFYYSFSVAIIRLVILLLVAYITKDVMKILYSIIIIQTFILLFNLSYFVRKKLIAFNINYSLLKEQIVYVFPLGIAGVLMVFNRDISKVVITNYLGASALALYAVASQRLPITNIIRSSITNVIFPDMAEMINREPLKALNLWKRSTVIYFFFMLPLFYLMFYYSRFIILTLFTKNYLGAIPVFQIYLIFFLKQSFDMGPPIIAMNKNKILLYGHILSFFVNVLLIALLYNLFGFIGPALAFVITELLLGIYFGMKIIKLYNIEIKEMFYWKKLFLLSMVGSLIVPILFIGDLIIPQNFLTVIFMSLSYIFIYLLIVKKLNIEEVSILLRKIIPNRFLK